MDHQNLDDLLDRVMTLTERATSWEAESGTNPGGMPNPRDVSHPMERVLRRMSDLLEANLLLNMALFEVKVQQAEAEES